jgi:hypothetical protein
MESAHEEKGQEGYTQERMQSDIEIPKSRKFF